jgi:tetratricopeptide (TPR) repeat protein
MAILAGGAPRKAVQLFDEILTMASERDPEATLPPHMLANRASALELLGRYAAAMEGYQAALRAAIETQTTPSQLRALLGLASAARASRDEAAASKYLSEADALFDPKMPSDHPLRFFEARIRGWLELDRGHADAAWAQFERASHEDKASPGPIDTLLGKAEVNLERGDTAAAMNDSRSALAAAKSLQGDFPYSDRTGLAYLTLARAMFARGENATARGALESAILHLSNTVDPGHPGLLEARRLLESVTRT